ncbi:type II CRISPR RNA-guided endonuclease Cas9 [Terrilactibacillus sp. S3-3]|nr:type II CRISPR RNA-guided endonuclease Cas9 [Terrilactibacillus sp. S3-3]
MWSAQRPFASKDDILKKIGNCTLEKNEKRAPKASYAFERFRALDKLSRLRILSKDRPNSKLTNEERELALNALFNKKEIRYQDLRKLLKLSDSERFNELYYDRSKTLNKNEDKTFLSLEGQYNIRKLMESVEESEAATHYRPVDFDTIAYALTVFKDDQDIRDYLSNDYVNQNGKRVRNLANRKYEDVLIEALLGLSFSKFGHLSLKALHKLLPYMEKGIPYHEACEKAGYHFNERVGKDKQLLLPVIPAGEIRNPVVARSLSQTRKVINGIIKRYGSPLYIYIELAREMGRPYAERRDLKKNNIIRIARSMTRRGHIFAN